MKELLLLLWKKTQGILRGSFKTLREEQRTSVIARVSPTSINPKGKQSTVEYTYKTKNMMKPEVNQQLPKGAVIEEDTEETKHLKGDLTAAQE